MENLTKLNIQYNKNLATFFSSTKKYKYYKIMFHITSQTNANNIMKNGFDTSKSKRGAFGMGINLSNKINHLLNYCNTNCNTIMVCMVKYNKLKKNSTNSENKEYFNQHEHSRPDYMYVPKKYDGFFTDFNIYVMRSKKNVCPLLSFKI